MRPSNFFSHVVVGICRILLHALVHWYCYAFYHSLHLVACILSHIKSGCYENEQLRKHGPFGTYSIGGSYSLPTWLIEEIQKVAHHVIGHRIGGKQVNRGGMDWIREKQKCTCLRIFNLGRKNLHLL